MCGVVVPERLVLGYRGLVNKIGGLDDNGNYELV